MKRKRSPEHSPVIGRDSKLIVRPKKKKVIKIHPPVDRNRIIPIAVLTMLGIISIYIACGVFLSVINMQH